MLFLIILFGLVAIAIAAPLSALSAPVDTLVTLTLFNDSSCTDISPPTLRLEVNKCYSFNGAQGLRATNHVTGLEYNARGFSSSKLRNIIAEARKSRP